MNAINQITQDDVETFEIESNRLGLINIANYYQNISTKSALYPGQGTALGLIYCGLKLNGEAGELAEHVGKAMRDDSLMHDKYCGYCHASGKDPLDDGKYCPRCKGTAESESKELTPQRRELIIKEIGDLLWYLSALCNELGITLAYAMLSNLRKLASRTARNALRGSGDDR